MSLVTSMPFGICEFRRSRTEIVKIRYEALAPGTEVKRHQREHPTWWRLTVNSFQLNWPTRQSTVCRGLNSAVGLWRPMIPECCRPCKDSNSIWCSSSAFQACFHLVALTEFPAPLSTALPRPEVWALSTSLLSISRSSASQRKLKTSLPRYF